MSDKNPIEIVLVVDDTGTARIKTFAAESQASFKQVSESGEKSAFDIKTAWEKLEHSWIAILGGLMAFKEAWEMMNTAAKAQQEEAAFASLAASYGANAEHIVESLREVSRGTVENSALIHAAGVAMMMGINPDNVVKLMDVAMDTARMTGKTTVEAFDSITTAVDRQSKKMMVGNGIIVDAKSANEAYAKSLGKTVEELTSSEKQQAFLNETLEKGADLHKLMGEQVDSSYQKFQRFHASIENIKEAIGGGLLRVFNGLEGALYKMGAVAWLPIGSFLELAAVATKVTDALHITSGAAEYFGKMASDVSNKISEMSAKGDQAYKDMISSNEGAINSDARRARALKDIEDAQESLEKSRKAIFDQAKKEAKELEKNQEDMYKETGQMADQHYAEEAKKVINRASDWKKAGGDIIFIQNWVYDQLGALEDEAANKGEVTSAAAMDRMQGQYRNLVDQLSLENKTVLDALTESGMKIKELDGSSFTVHANLDGSGFENTANILIDKFRALANAASSAAAQRSSSVSFPAGESNAESGTESNSPAGEKSLSENNSSTIININQQVSRSDVNSIINEQKRIEARK